MAKVKDGWHIHKVKDGRNSYKQQFVYTVNGRVLYGCVVGHDYNLVRVYPYKFDRRSKKFIHGTPAYITFLTGDWYLGDSRI